MREESKCNVKDPERKAAIFNTDCSHHSDNLTHRIAYS